MDSSTDASSRIETREEEASGSTEGSGVLETLSLGGECVFSSTDILLKISGTASTGCAVILI